MNNKNIYFFIGTEAELIKLFPIMLELEKRAIDYKIIASGQNDITKSFIIKVLAKKTVDVELSYEKDIKKSSVGLLKWFFATYLKAKKTLPLKIANKNNAILVVHGDTVSTMMGAFLGKRMGLTVAHVEAGLRSHNWLNPFPEEIDRVLTSKCARVHFAPGEKAKLNLLNARVKGAVVDTHFNTIIDSLIYSKTIECKNNIVNSLIQKKYFVFVIHRQENLANETLVRSLYNAILEKSTYIHCVIIFHEITRIAFEKLGLLKEIENNINITILSRTEYFDFMKLLDNSQFVITDGGSNQEELSLMGKPCLIIRKHTERSDGIGKNAVLYEGDLTKIDYFVENYKKFIFEQVATEISPSKVIVDYLIN